MKNKPLLTLWLLTAVFFAGLPHISLGYYEISNSKVNGETKLGTFTKTLKPQTEAVLQLPEIPGWYPADNTNPMAVEMDFVEKDLVVFTALSKGLSASRVCNDYTTQCITLLITVTDPESYTAKAPMLKNGQLALDSNTVYIIYKHTKTPFTNYPAFTGLGYKLNQISYIGSLAHIPNSGYMIEKATDWHPWGSWVKQGKQIYLITELGLMPITTMEIFTNNGGKTQLVVPMNQADTLLPRISVMEMSDWRLN